MIVIYRSQIWQQELNGPKEKFQDLSGYGEWVKGKVDLKLLMMKNLLPSILALKAKMIRHVSDLQMEEMCNQTDAVQRSS